VSKPGKIALGIGVAAVACAALAVATGGAWRLAWAWTAAACVVACAAYVANRPDWLGKRRGGWGARAVLVLPYLAAFRIACALMRRWRGGDAPSAVAPGLWVGGRVTPGSLPPGVAYVVDLVAEYPAHRGVRRLAGYRCLPVLDGGVPADVDAFLVLVRELVAVDGDVLVHCDSGRGRAPTFAAALAIARGDGADVAPVLAAMRALRPVVAPTRSDLAFLARVLPALRAVAGAWRRREAGGMPATR
jgi:protein-tyrosine phosphatase